jgi:mRNA interferase MazF
VLLSRDEAYRFRASITAAEITSTIRQIPVEVLLTKEDGLPKMCVANLDSIITFQKGLLKDRICLLSPEKLEAVNRAIKFALALE